LCRVFGLTNLTSLRDGKVGRECRGEEHIVEIVRNKTSGKIRIHWNNYEITRYFRQRYFPVDSIVGRRTVEYNWKTRSDETIRVVGYIDDSSCDESIKFDLFVDGVNFTNLSTVGQLGRKIYLNKKNRVPEDDSRSQISLGSSIATNDLDDNFSSGTEQGFRLSMVGFNSWASGEDRINDELHSDLYSNSLTSLRNQIITRLPQTEEMVSRAIINAFFVDAQSYEHSYTFRSLEEMDCNRIEADYMYDARCWLRLNVDIAPRPDIEDLSLQFLQRCIENIFLLIRNEDINSDEAAQIVMSVAQILGLQFSVNIETDTILIDDIPVGTTKKDLQKILSQFGEIDAVSISSRSPTFGFCRYVFAESTCQLMSAYNDGNIIVNGIQPTLCLIFQPDENVSDATSGKHVHDGGLRIVTDISKFPVHRERILSSDVNGSPNTVIHERHMSYSFYESEITHQHYFSSSTAACY
jgi:hypothetical protein